MIATIQVTHCAQCGKQITMESPPSKKRYEKAEIQLPEHSTMLLPVAVVEKAKKTKGYESHACSLEGWYCTPDCLKARIDSILAGN